MKLLITADLHLHDFPFPNPKARLAKFQELGQYLGRLADETKAEALVIAGDIFHVSNPNPRTLVAAQKFFNEIPIRIMLTHGQHDLHIRAGKEITENSIITALSSLGLPIEYYHRQSESGVYFYGWEPKYQLPKEANDSSLIITHATLTGARLASGWAIKDGATIDKDGPIVFAGDIHKYQKLGRVVIPGPPIQHSFGDDPDVGILIYDTQTEDLKRVPTGILQGKRIFSFYRFLNEEPKDKTELDFVSKKKPKKDPKVVVNNLGLDPLEAISKAARDRKLTKIHQRILKAVGSPSTTIPNLKFKLKRLRLVNFLTHSNLDLNLEDYPGLVLILGPNGSGKSSLFEAIKFALQGGSGAPFVRVGAKEMTVELTLEYNGLTYSIVRKWNKKGVVEFYADGEPIQGRTINDTNRLIQETIIPVNYLDLWYWNQYVVGPLSSRTQQNRFELITDFLGLNILASFNQEAQNEVSSLRKKLTYLRGSLETLTSVQQETRRVGLSSEEKARLDELVSEIPSLEAVFNKVQKLKQDVQGTYRKSSGKVALLSDKLARENRSLEQIQQQKHEAQTKRVCPVCGSELNTASVQQLVADYDEKIRSSKSMIAFYNDGIQQEQAALDEASKRLEELSQKAEFLDKKLAQLKQELVELQAKQKVTTHEDITNKIEVTTKEIATIERKVAQLDAYIELTSPKGEVIVSILTALENYLSEDTVRVKTVKRLRSGELRPNFSLEMNVNGEWIDFAHLSGGQKSLAEIQFFSKLASIVGGIGELLLDESFRYLDSVASEKALAALQAGGIQRVWLVSHHEVIPNVEDVIRVDTLVE